MRIIGDIDHRDFYDVVQLLQNTSQLASQETNSPELIIVAQSRPGVVGDAQITTFRCQFPLASIIALVGTWCEGEPRTGRPCPGVPRLYWYEFPVWWRRQLLARAAGHCPEWAHVASAESRYLPGCRDCGPRIGAGSPKGLVVVNTSNRETFATFSNALSGASYSSLEQRPHHRISHAKGCVAGIWEGGQLDDRETIRLAEFCQALAMESAPTIAILDFPRRDRVDAALQLGASAVLGKPCANTDLLAVLDSLASRTLRCRAA